MARGWESKSVEDQVEEFQDSNDSPRRQPPLEPSDMEARRLWDVLLLSKARVQADLEASRNPRYREQLARALLDIESQLARLRNVS